MPRVVPDFVFRASLSLCILPICLTPAFGQGRGGSDWSTVGNDAQRSAWVRTDPKISAAALQKPGFQFMWKVKLGKAPLTSPALMDRYIGYRGFRSYAFIGDRANNVYTLDSDLSRVEWQKQAGAAASAGTATCPGGMTASVTRPVTASLPNPNMGGRGGGGGRGGPAKSGVGMAGEGAITIPAPAPPQAAPAARGPAPAGGGGGRGRQPSYLNVLTADGAFHSMYISNGEEPNPPVKFLPAGANAADLTMLEDGAYVVTSGNCGGVADGVWALDPASKAVVTWKGSAVGTAFAPDAVYVTTAGGEIVALTAKTLQQKASYAAGQAFVSSPVVFQAGGKTFVAAIAKDGSVYVVDAAGLTKIAVSSPQSGGAALATWQDAAGTAWILSGNTAWKLAGSSLQSGWNTTGSISSAAVVNGVVFLAGGATLRGFDAASGKELFNSGKTITSPVSGGISAGGSAIYLGSQDGTLYAFGYPIEH